MVHETSSDFATATADIATATGVAGLALPAASRRPILTTRPTDVSLAYALGADAGILNLRGTLLALVRRDGRDLTARQLTVFLTVYIDEEVHSVSSLADLLRISRPGITRVMDRLVQFDLVAREEDQRDRRRVLVRRTLAGAAFCKELIGITREVSATVARSE